MEYDHPLMCLRHVKAISDNESCILIEMPLMGKFDNIVNNSELKKTRMNIMISNIIISVKI